MGLRVFYEDGTSMSRHNLSVKYQEDINKICEKLTIPGIDIIAIFIYLNNGQLDWLSNCPAAASEYATSGLYRGDILQQRQFRQGNRVIFTDEYKEADHMQSRIAELMTKNDFYRIYCISRFCSDCSLLFATNRKGGQESNPQQFYKETIDEFEDFCCYLTTKTLPMFYENLPTLKNTRFASDERYRELVIKNRNDPPTEKLTTGEIDVLYWAAQGKTSEETGMLLGLTKNSLDTYRKRAIAKLNAANITHAVYIASLYGLIA
jgi:DNA-binding CsgD family transcriptional regulator